MTNEGHWVEKEKIFFVFKYKSNTFDRIKKNDPNEYSPKKLLKFF